MENKTSTETLDPKDPNTAPSVPPGAVSAPVVVPVETPATVQNDTGNGDMPPPGKP